MRLIPAIDIRGGHAVRLVQGDYDRELRFDADPLDAAHRWVEEGASWLHVVDLDGAREGAPVNLEHVERIATETGALVELGGGLRDADAVERVLGAGAQRVVIGTAALTSPELVEALVATHGPERVAVSIDVRAGEVAHSGWRERSSASPAGLVREMSDRGVRSFVYTPVEADGMLEGPALDGLHELPAAMEKDAETIYAGGIGTTAHLEQLAALDLEGLAGVIVGRALYEGKFTVPEGQAALDSA